MILWIVENAVEMLPTTVWTAREISFSCVLLKVKDMYSNPSRQLNKDIISVWVWCVLNDKHTIL